MKITIHQPEHMPWLGFFHKIAQVDACVILDDVQFEKNYFQNRNKIRYKDGANWICVPVHAKSHTNINEVMIAQDGKWHKKWFKFLEQTYSASKYGNLYLQDIKIIVDKNFRRLYELNFELIKYLCECLGISIKFIISSEAVTMGKASDKILNICLTTKADTYLSGISGKGYLKLEDFSNAGIKVEFQEFHHPIYRQMHEPFMPCMSVIDLLCNYGPDSLDVIFGENVKVMTDLFG
jgi:hypothetical protein